MSATKVTIAALAFSVFAFAANAQDAGDLVAGEKVFAKCKACHVADEAKNKVGPTLLGVLGRTPGTVEGFKYSKAMVAYGEENVWNEETLTEYLKAPRAVVKGTRMAFAGLKKDEDVANVLAYINQFSE